MSVQKANDPWLFDLRIRDRNLKSGALDEKELTKYLGALPDHAESVVPFHVNQSGTEEDLTAADDDGESAEA